MNKNAVYTTSQRKMDKAVFSDDNLSLWPAILSNLNTQRDPEHPERGVLSSGDIRF